MICILARDRKPEYYEKLKDALEAGIEHIQRERDCCMYKFCYCCDYDDIYHDLEQAILFLEGEQLRAELKRQKKLPK